jgi:hypothetical protein
MSDKMNASIILLIILLAVTVPVIAGYIFIWLNQPKTWLPESIEVPEPWWDREYFRVWNDKEEVPCIVCNAMIPRHHSVIVRAGYRCGRHGS